ncbi:MAG: DUF6268 family outer membrane beta-barrel protein, partial [Bacteroidota bacterium]
GFFPNDIQAQFANSNFGLRSKMGFTLNHEISKGSFDFDGRSVDLTQQVTNFQASFPLLKRINTRGTRVRLNILKAEYTFRNIENVYPGSSIHEQSVLKDDFYANSLNLSYLHTVRYPWMMVHSLRLSYAGDYSENTPLQINASSFALYRVNKNLLLGLGVLYQQMEHERSFLVVPYLDWRSSNQWFVDITAPDRILIGKNIGRKKHTQIAWGTYLEFLTRFTFQQNGQNRVYENFDISSGLDFRTKVKGKLFFNAFVGNNFYKNISIRNNELDRLESGSAFSGLNARLGLSFNLED